MTCLRLLLFLLLISLSLTGCEYINRLNDDGIVIKQNLSTASLQHIVVNAPCRLVLHNAADTAYVRGLDYLISDLELNEDMGTLNINHSHKEFLRKSEAIEIHLPAAQIQKITAHTTLELRTDDTITTDRFAIIMNGEARFSEVSLRLNCQQLTLNVYGNNNIGNFMLAGRCQQSFITLEGAVNIDALRLISNTSMVHHKSIGQCRLFVNDKLDVTTYSSGNTYYKGMATTHHKRVTVSYLPNTGKLIKID
ncbi:MULTISPECIES: GIN domain-containing protein [unclassified Carboxylicivirga]|uniref:GIN domain-containing protein n=1 Tax=Carboxylicivirga TaxID=1628153 RepID=UPI003D3367C2